MKMKSMWPRIIKADRDRCCTGHLLLKSQNIGQDKPLHSVFVVPFLLGLKMS